MYWWMLKFPGFLGVLGLFVFGCSTEYPTQKLGDYYSVDSLLESQIQYLLASQASVQKTVMIGAEKQSRSFRPDSAEWRKELTDFFELDPNHARDVNAFADSSTAAGISLRRKEKGNGLQALKIARTANGTVLGMNGELLQTTEIYTNRRTLLMEFLEGKIQYYELRGFQKMILSDTVFFAVEVKIE